MGKNPPTNFGDIRTEGSIPGSGRFPGGGHGNPLWYSSLENPVDRGAWRVTVHRVIKSPTRLKQLSMHAIRHRGYTAPFEAGQRAQGSTSGILNRTLDTQDFVVETNNMCRENQAKLDNFCFIKKLNLCQPTRL